MEIELTQGRWAKIDDEDWPLVAPYKWYAAKQTDGRWYAQTTPAGGTCNSTKIKMHNLILGLKSVDHWNRDGLDNRKANLRPCTDAQNQQNTTARGGASSFKGVSWASGKGQWRVAFRCNGKHHFVGYFTDEEQAARAYDDAILPLAGEFARLNFPALLHTELHTGQERNLEMCKTLVF